MKTPIFDFVKSYAERKSVRFHMPGHKGVSALGCEPLDITEIKGADVLYSADGIIAESEDNLSSLYGTAHSFYSTEGSTLAIKAMLALVISEVRKGERPVILAGRNAHASFIRAAALLDIDVRWIRHSGQQHLCECSISASDIQLGIDAIGRTPCAVYVTSPDYLGNMLDISSLAKFCRERNIPLISDNAHGAYLKFLPKDLHPISLGAAMCVDSAHKTLPVLTGGAYLHISRDFPEYAEKARDVMSIFASTSPSYLTLASLDLCNKRLADGYADKIAALALRVEGIKEKIVKMGYRLNSDGSRKALTEPFKITLRVGESLASHLRKNGIEPEYSDSEYTVLMLSPDNTDADLEYLISALDSYSGERSAEVPVCAFPAEHERVMTIREAIFSPSELVSAENSLGRICAAPTVSCPPAVPIVISGERITKEDIRLFKHYGIEKVSVVIEK